MTKYVATSMAIIPVDEILYVYSNAAYITFFGTKTNDLYNVYAHLKNNQTMLLAADIPREQLSVLMNGILAQMGNVD